MAEQIADILYHNNKGYIYRISYGTLKQAQDYARRLRKRTGLGTAIIKTIDGIYPGARIPFKGTVYSVYLRWAD